MTISISRCRIREAFLTCSAAFGRSINKTNRKSPNWAQNSCFPIRTSRNNKKSNKNANKNEISTRKVYDFNLYKRMFQIQFLQCRGLLVSVQVMMVAIGLTGPLPCIGVEKFLDTSCIILDACTRISTLRQ